MEAPENRSGGCRSGGYGGGGGGGGRYGGRGGGACFSCGEDGHFASAVERMTHHISFLCSMPFILFL
nr:hypothetical protein Iba_chr10fCG9610 [Ipomoea batatas]